MFADGSCVPGYSKALWRAGWGVVQVDAVGHPVRRAHGVVPRHLAQNAVIAEWAALTVAIQFAAPRSGEPSGRVTIWQDCRAVTDEWRKPWRSRLRHGSKHAGMCRALWQYRGARRCEVKWTKGHVAATENLGPEGRLRALGGRPGCQARRPQPPASGGGSWQEGG